MRCERYVFEYLCNRPAVVFRPVVEHLRRLLKPRIDFCKGLVDCAADFQDCFCKWHLVDSSQLARSVPGKRQNLPCPIKRNVKRKVLPFGSMPIFFFSAFSPTV